MTWLNLTGLVALSAAVPLIALYFLRSQRKRVVVPSLLMWRALAEKERQARPFGRFQRNLLLLLQLLAVAALATAFARPAVLSTGGTSDATVWVLDTSASMSAVDVAPSRFGVAVRAIQQRIDAMGPNAEAMLIQAGARTRVLAPFTSDKTALRNALATARIEHAEGTLRDGLQLATSLAESRPNSEVLVFSDGGDPAVAELPPPTVPVELVTIGERTLNAGITQLDVRAPATPGAAPQLFVTLEAYGTEPMEASIEVYQDGKPIGVRALELTPGEPTPLVFTTEPVAEGSQVARVELHAEGDLLAADNTAWAMVQPVDDRRVLVVGADLLSLRALAADPTLHLLLADPAQFHIGMLADVDCALFFGTAPADVAGRNYAVLTPTNGGLVRFGEPIELPIPTSYDRRHPALSYVGVDTARIARVREVEDPGGLAVIADSSKGPLILAGQRGGNRVLQLAFHPLESDLPVRVAWPVFLLNTVSWLTEGASGSRASAALSAGSPWLVATGEALEPDTVCAYGPDGGALPVHLTHGLAAVSDTTSLGLYELRLPDEVRYAAINLVSRRESDLAPQDALRFAGTVGPALTQEAPTRYRELWRMLAALGLVGLMLEWLLYHRRLAG